MPIDTQPQQPDAASLARAVQRPEWQRVETTTRTHDIGRSSIYDLINEGKIKSCSIKKRGNTRGIRLIHIPSLDAYLHSISTAAAAPEADSPVSC